MTSKSETLKRISQMAQAIKQFTNREQWFTREAERGVQAAHEGRLVDHADVKSKWEAKRATQLDWLGRS